MEALCFEDLAALLSGDKPLPPSRSLVYRLPLSEAQVKLLVPLIQDSSELRQLKLRGCRLSDSSAQELSRALAFIESLRTLDLRDNDIGEVGKFEF